MPLLKMKWLERSERARVMLAFAINVAFFAAIWIPVLLIDEPWLYLVVILFVPFIGLPNQIAIKLTGINLLRRWFK